MLNRITLLRAVKPFAKNPPSKKNWRSFLLANPHPATPVPYPVQILFFFVFYSKKLNEILVSNTKKNDRFFSSNQHIFVFHHLSLRGASYFSRHPTPPHPPHPIHKMHQSSPVRLQYSPEGGSSPHGFTPHETQPSLSPQARARLCEERYVPEDIQQADEWTPHTPHTPTRHNHHHHQSSPARSLSPQSIARLTEARYVPDAPGMLHSEAPPSPRSVRREHTSSPASRSSLSPQAKARLNEPRFVPPSMPDTPQRAERSRAKGKGGGGGGVSPQQSPQRLSRFETRFVPPPAAEFVG